MPGRDVPYGRSCAGAVLLTLLLRPSQRTIDAAAQLEDGGSYATSSRVMTVRLADGTAHSALVKFS